jgi:hypothetical protein
MARTVDGLCESRDFCGWVWKREVWDYSRFQSFNSAFGIGGQLFPLFENRRAGPDHASAAKATALSTQCIRRKLENVGHMTFVTYEITARLNENPLRAFAPGARERVRLRRILKVGVFLAASVGLAAARDLALVSNKGNTVTVLTVPELVKVCKAQTGRWPDGKPVTFIMRAPSVPEMKLLLEKIYELPDAQVTDLIATANHGRTNHPAILVANSDEDLVNKVASIPGAVGVVDVYAINSSVAVVKLAGKLPMEPGYLLHGN